MDTILNADIKSVIEKAEAYCSEEEIEIKLVYKLSNKTLELISERSKELATLYYVDVEMLRTRAENGCFILKKNDRIYGHIFVHEHQVKGHSVYERTSLWVDRDCRNCNLGLLLMSRMTELFSDTFLISVAQTPKVHHYNELLGMTHVTLAKMSTVLVEELEKLGKLRDELNFKYYVNDCFKSEIGQLKQI
ncbi:GNAT family N-acetyltransferase [Algibacter lectus]|uniref:Acetyltransferase (GNAT) family protein n=1 Tax=Algibacter lectus TaxID=221126 RepID=A0A090VH35_9FLAO|nr:GNAT family N-acetyltransferase [Algibacter lectus]MDO7137740.1 GNAT family N-acetyltransferase [Algibacter lectus]MWW25622.1 GNAT family N-acetyltransferase [Algibacter lectus]TDY61568.1 acetyltransferase (GNAT) family protein [Algibacter lectus]SFD14091.1 hypothetical protein SAMN04489722_105286 [Algibacter lectus]GAL64075.1 hypothetical protein JCM19300_3278 [Algibacter lectus]